MSLIIRVIYEGTTYDLDIQEDVPLRLDVSAIENTEIGEFFGVGSQTFDIPGTKNNNKFFKHAYNIGGEDIPAFYNTIDGKIISKGDTILTGQFQLLETIKDEAGYVNYKCQITDETVQFKDAIQNKLIKDADWSEYQHTLNIANITGSWSNQLLGGTVYYPLADYGYNDPESQGNYPLFAFADDTNGIQGNFINNSLTPIQPQQFLPSVRAKDTLEVICAQAGFSASGDFINSGYFSNLFLLPKAKEEIGIVVSGSEQATGYAINNYNQQIPPNTTNQELALNQVVVDPLGKFFTSGSEGYGYYLADGNGEYEVSAQIGFFNPVSFSTAVVEVEINLMRGSFPFSGAVIASTKQEFRSTDGFQTFTLSVGGSFNSTTVEDVWVWINYTTISGPTPPNLNPIGFNSKLEVSKAPEVYNNATVNMADQWPADLKSIDIVTGIIQQFNLVVYPHETQAKTIVFEQFDDWIREGEVKDWTDKWDTATRVSIKHTIDEEPQQLILTNEDDADRFSVEAKESDPFFQYGTLRILADNNISQGSKTVKNAFGPTVLGGPYVSGSVTAEGNPTYNIDLGSSFAFPHLYKFENNQLKSYKFRTRIGFKSNNSFPSGSRYKMALGTSGADSVLISGSYGTLSNVNGLPARDGDADLHFNNTYFKFAGPGLNLGNTKSNFDEYWKTYIDSLYWDENRKVTLDIQFDSEEYKDIKLNDIIFVKDQQYRINKISGFNVTQDDVATVELIRLYPAYYSANPDCNFSIRLEELDCDFTFEAIAGAGPTPTPSPTPIPTCTQYFARTNQPQASFEVEYTCCITQNTITRLITQGYGSEDTTNNEIRFASSTTPVFTEIKPNIPQPLYTYGAFGDISASYDTIDYSQTETFTVKGDGSSTGSIRYYNSFVDTASCDWNCDEYIESNVEREITIISGSLRTLRYNDTLIGETLIGTGSSNCVGPVTPTPTPSPSPTLPPGPTPTPTPGGQTPTPTPTPTVAIFSYTGLVANGSYQNACSSSTEVTIYTRGEIGTGSVAYEDSS